MINKLCKDGNEIRITMYVTKPAEKELYHLNSTGNIDRIDDTDRFLLHEYLYIVKSGWDDLFQMDNEDMQQLDEGVKEDLR
jgi:hypothetical protein